MTLLTAQYTLPNNMKAKDNGFSIFQVTFFFLILICLTLMLGSCKEIPATTSSGNNRVEGIAELSGAAELSVSPESLKVTSESGSVKLAIETADDPALEWEISSEEDWLSFDPASGSGPDTVVITYEQNTLGVSRKTDIMVRSNAGDVSVPIKQTCQREDDEPCEPAPNRPESNDFNLSGSVARETGRTVRVTLNAIMIDGEVVTDLSEENFMIIEDSCAKNISDLSTNNIGIDLAFVQDLSGSMGSAITGVRNSVISFADDLAEEGINIQIGSVGYSGNGTIPSTPGTPPCEFLGPVQDVTDPTTFRDHVAENWNAFGGCDGPENGLEAIEYAHENLSWRTGAARVYVDITDVSHHTDETNCNGTGPCTDQSLDSIVELVGETSTIHAIAPDNEFIRTLSGGLDPWLLADRTGGEALILPPDGVVDLAALGIADVIGEAVSFTFESASLEEADHSLRIRVEINGKVAELDLGAIRYKQLSSDLSL